METLTVENVGIEGIAACVPSREEANEEKVAKATGIVTRRIAEKGMTVVDLCVRAAERVLADTGSSPADFGAILCVSFTQYERMPSAAIQAQARLGFPNGIIAFDVMLACSGWGYGLYLAGLLARQTGKKTLLLDGDVQSAFMADGDAATAPLLADGGTATIVGAGDDSWRFAFVADGAKGEALRLERGGSIRMDGFGVFRFVATDVVRYVREFRAAAAPSLADGDLWFVPHQPNVYMVRQLAKSVGFDEAHTAISCDRLGNLSSASVPTTIVWKGVRGEVLFTGFGGGLSVSLGAIRIGDGCRLAVVEA